MPGFSQMALWYIGGLIKHGPALAAIIAPTTNSYKRLVPGFEAPVNLAYSRRNRSAACRIPMYSASPEGQARGVPSAGSELQSLPGICGDDDGGAGRHREQDRSRASRWTRTSTTWGRKSWPRCRRCRARWKMRWMRWSATTPSCSRATCSPRSCSSTYIEYKRTKEVDAVRLRPHPYEFALYYDI